MPPLGGEGDRGPQETYADMGVGESTQEIKDTVDIPLTGPK